MGRSGNGGRSVRGFSWPVRWLFRILTTLLVLVLVAAGAVVWTVRASFPELDGELRLAGFAEPVKVLRDGDGVPQIYADTADLFMAQGYVHAQDRFWEMDFRRKTTAGRLSELFGDSTLEIDKVIRTLGWRRGRAGDEPPHPGGEGGLAPRRRGELLDDGQRRLRLPGKPQSPFPSSPTATMDPNRGRRSTPWPGPRRWPGTCGPTSTTRSSGPSTPPPSDASGPTSCSALPLRPAPADRHHGRRPRRRVHLRRQETQAVPPRSTRCERSRPRSTRCPPCWAAGADPKVSAPTRGWCPGVHRHR